MPKLDILKQIVEARLIAILRRIPSAQVGEAVNALISGGIQCIEITADSEGVFNTIEELARRFSDKLCIGAGTILDSVSCKLAILSGAQYIVTPIVNIDVIEMANRYGKPCIAGAMTPTEIVTAYQHGAEIIKVFPAASLGASYFKEIASPLCHIPLMATGGINLENIDTFVKAGVTLFGVGSSLVEKEALNEGNYKKITKNAESFKQVLNLLLA